MSSCQLKLLDYRQKVAVFRKISRVGFTNLAFFKRLHVKVPHVSSADTTDFKEVAFFALPAFESPKMAQAEEIQFLTKHCKMFQLPSLI